MKNICFLFLSTILPSALIYSNPKYDFYNYDTGNEKYLAIYVSKTKSIISDLPSEQAARMDLKKETIRPYEKPKSFTKKENYKEYIKEKHKSGTIASKSKYVFKRPFSKKLKPFREFNDDSFNPHRGVLFEHEQDGFVQSALSGKVVAVDSMDGYGNYIIIEHDNGYTTVYANLNQINVFEGQKVETKERLGILSKNRGLYFQVNIGRIAINPKIVLKN